MRLMKPVLTIRETASEYQMPELAVRTLAKNGAFPVIQLGQRIYISRDAFEEYLRSGGNFYRPDGKE